MCLLCDDEKAYQAYMNYFDAMERQGKAADPEAAVNAVLDQLEAQDKARAKLRERADDPANDKTLSPFFCSPINK
ncbi:MAG TPA: hypothetical protein VM910_38745 [Bradyrhizobium sp.]|nr:hypothetical protein [Bradyrhizobium sp.]